MILETTAYSYGFWVTSDARGISLWHYHGDRYTQPLVGIYPVADSRVTYMVDIPR